MHARTPMCAHTYVHTHLCRDAHINTHTCTHTYMHCTRTSIHTCTCTITHTYMRAHKPQHGRKRARTHTHTHTKCMHAHALAYTTCISMHNTSMHACTLIAHTHTRTFTHAHTQMGWLDEVEKGGRGEVLCLWIKLWQWQWMLAYFYGLSSCGQADLPGPSVMVNLN